MKSHFLYIALALLTSCNSHSNEELIVFKANWEVGKKTRFRVEKTKEDFNYGHSPGQYEVIQIAEQEVLNRFSDGYKLQWKIVENIYSDHIEMDASQKLIYERMTKELVIQYITDHQGSFREVINWKDILNFHLTIMNKVSDIIEEEENIEYEQIRTMIEGMFGSKKQIEALFIEELQLLHTYYSFTFKPNKIAPRSLYIPNIFGGPSVPVNSTIIVENTNVKSGELIGQEKFNLNEYIKNRMLSVFIESMELDNEDSSLAATQLAETDVSILDLTDFNLDFERGIVNTISYTRNMTVQSAKQDLRRIKKTSITKID